MPPAAAVPAPPPTRPTTTTTPTTNEPNTTRPLRRRRRRLPTTAAAATAGSILLAAAAAGIMGVAASSTGLTAGFQPPPRPHPHRHGGSGSPSTSPSSSHPSAADAANGEDDGGAWGVGGMPIGIVVPAVAASRRGSMVEERRRPAAGMNWFGRRSSAAAAAAASSSSSSHSQQRPARRAGPPSPHDVWTGHATRPPRGGLAGVGAATAYAPVAGLGWQQQQQGLEAGPSVQQGSLSIATFNVLAPCYKRMRNGGREADFPERMEQRALETADFIRREVATDIICLQEYFLEERYRGLFEAELGEEYDFIIHPRPSKRDGCAVLVRKGMFSVKAVRGTTLSRWGSRVGLLVDLHADLSSSSASASSEGGPQQNILLVNSHLSFPHNRFDVNNQHRQVNSLARMISSYVKGKEQQEGRPQRMLQIVAGDFNLERDNPLLSPLLTSGFEHFAAGRGDGAHVGVTHRTHRGEEVAVDHIFYRPYDSRVDRVGGGASPQQRQVEEEQQRRRRPFLDLIMHWGAGERRPGEEQQAQQQQAASLALAAATAATKEQQQPQPQQLPTPAAAALATAAPAVEVEVVDVALLPTNLTAAAWPASTEFRISDHRPLKVHLNITM